MANPEDIRFENDERIAIYPTTEDGLLLIAFSQMIYMETGHFFSIMAKTVLYNISLMGRVDGVNIMNFERSLIIEPFHLLSALSPIIGKEGPLYTLISSFFSLPLFNQDGHICCNGTVHLLRPLGTITKSILDVYLTKVLDPHLPSAFPHTHVYRANSELIVPIKDSLAFDFDSLAEKRLSPIGTWL